MTTYLKLYAAREFFRTHGMEYYAELMDELMRKLKE